MFTARQLQLASELNRAIRRQDWCKAHRLLTGDGVGHAAAWEYLLEEYDRAKRDDLEPAGDR
jgi:hypothetical protein